MKEEVNSCQLHGFMVFTYFHKVEKCWEFMQVVWNETVVYFYLVAGNETKAEMPNLINQFKTWWEAHRTISDLEQYLSFLK